MIKLASPDIRENDLNLVIECLRSGNLVQGEYVDQFEKALIRFTKIDNCAVVSSGTAAIHLALKALNIKQNDKVIVPAFTFPATANVVENLNAEIVLCDVCEKSYVITPELLEECINNNNNIKALILVDEFGYPPDLEKISDICKKHSIKLIEDAACALGTKFNEHHIGYYSDAACISFHPRKAITTGEGGAVLSRNETLIGLVKQYRNHGIHKIKDRVDFILPGLNYRLTNFQAALGLGQLSRFHDELRTRKILAAIYLSELSNHSRISLPKSDENHSWQSFMICLANDVNRDKIVSSMRSMNIETNIGAQAINCLTYYKNKYSFEDNSYPNATKLYNNGLVLPLYGKLDEDNIQYISNSLKRILAD